MATESEASEYLAVLKASYDYAPQSDDEIAMQENQLLFLLERVDDDWWRVKVKGDTQDAETAVGLVPAAYVEPADHTSVVKTLYDYEANAPGELSVKEDELLFVYDTEDEWLLVQSQSEGGKAGFVPGNYVEAASEDSPSQSTSAVQLSSIVVPDSPRPPPSNYQDPADRVAATSVKAKADSIQTWSVSEIDKKGKKKKGTFGVGNGAAFFASESDKTPVQKWQTADIDRVTIEKSKHIHITVVGPTPANLHFQASSKDNAEAISEKLQSSKALSTDSPARPVSQKDSIDHARPPPILTEGMDHDKARKSGASVHFSEASPVIIPPRAASEEGEEGREEDEESHEGIHKEVGDAIPAVALYDFDADGEDELSVKEGEQLYVLEREGDQWWKCQNTEGAEGVVPASYLELTESTPGVDATSPSAETTEQVEAADDGPDQAELDRIAAEQAEKDRIARDRAEKRELADKIRAEADRKKAARLEATATADRRVDAGTRIKPVEKPAPSSSPPSNNRPSSGSSKPRFSADGTRPPSDQTRIWHDRTGQFRVEAAFLGYHGGKLRLHKVNGVVVEVPSEKMSQEDLRYVEKLMSRKKSSSKPVNPSEDDEPLATRRKSLQTDSARTSRASQRTKAIDWFEFFLSAGCDVDDCTRYAAAFEKDKIDEAILPDITDSTMRSLGLREGDIIRVTKAIEKTNGRDKKASTAREDQIARDEEYAKQLQAEEANRKQSPAPNLFAGPSGALKNNTARRGRPQPSRSLPPATVDLNAISSASDQIQRTGSPQVTSASAAAASPPSPLQPPKSASSLSPPSGFGDDAWTNRPSSAKPSSTAPSASTPRSPSAPPPASASAPAQPRPSSQQQNAGSMDQVGKGLAKTTEADIFDQLARLNQFGASKPSPSPAATSPAAVVTPPPASFQAGLGVGPSPVPIGQHLQNQQAGLMQPPQPISGPRGPFAPVPANQTLLQPLVPTNTGFNSFVPTRPGNVPPLPTQAPPPPLPSFIGSVPTFQPSQPLMSQPLMSQPTGVPFGVFNAGTNFQGGGFTPLPTQPTGFNPNFGTPSFNGTPPPPLPPPVSDIPSPANIFAQMKMGASLPPAPPPPSNNTTPANVFAQMKSGTFASGNENTTPQPSAKYDALRTNPLATQPTGWGYQGSNYQIGYPL